MKWRKNTTRLPRSIDAPSKNGQTPAGYIAIWRRSCREPAGLDEAKQAFAELMLTYPDLTISKFKQAMVFSPAVLDRMAANLRKLGLPD